MAFPPLPPQFSLEHLKVLVTAVGVARSSGTALAVLRRYCPADAPPTPSRVPADDREAACRGLLAELGADVRAAARIDNRAARRATFAS